MKTDRPPEWTIRLRVSPEQRKQIHKEAIDRGLTIAEYVKLKVLEGSSIPKHFIKGKTA